MLEKMAMPLLVVKAMRELRGKTRLQKLACLVEFSLRAKGRTLGFHFETYHYGPFSFDLAKVVQDLVDQGLLLEAPEQTPNGYIQYAYKLTSDGERLVEDLLRRETSLMQLETEISIIVQAHGYLPLESLVTEAYAAFENAGAE